MLKNHPNRLVKVTFRYKPKDVKGDETKKGLGERKKSKKDER
jgi:hypothetical protein